MAAAVVSFPACFNGNVIGLRTPTNDIFHKERLVRRFIRQAGECKDTPSLIVTIAADTDFLKLCRAIVDPAMAWDPTFAKTVESVCRNHGLHLQRLKEKLTPAAEALGLLSSPDSATDFYRLLGVRSQADTQEIISAFHKKAVEVHPDANVGLVGNGRRFIELNHAYQTLRDPLRRRQYDANRSHSLHWFERPGRYSSADSRPAIFLGYLCVLFFIFMLLLIVLDIVVL